MRSALGVVCRFRSMSVSRHCTASLRSAPTNKLRATSAGAQSTFPWGLSSATVEALNRTQKCDRLREASGPALPASSIHGTRRNHGHDGCEHTLA